MEDKINNAKLSFTCNRDWNNMEPDAEGRFCDSCQKKVYDLTDKNVAYFINIMQENKEGFCGRFSSDQLMAPLPVDESRWKRWLVTAMVFVGIGAIGQKASAQSTLLGKPQAATVSSDCDSRAILGEVVITSRITVEDKNKLQKYMLSNCKLDKSVSGRFDMSFNLNREGEVTIVLGASKLPKQARLEITRVLKNGVKLIRSNLNTDFPYQISITFIKGRVQSLVNF
jgi:hypothetical protein